MSFLKKLILVAAPILKPMAKAVVTKEITKVQNKLNTSNTTQKIEHEGLEYLKIHVNAL